MIENHTHGPEREKIDWGRKVRTALPAKNDKKFDAEPVQLRTRQPHFDSESLKMDVSNDDDDDEHSQDIAVKESAAENARAKTKQK